MKLNRIEKFLMNNPVRSLIQRKHEAAILENLGGKTTGERVLEIGCGRGVGTEIIFERFRASEVDAFDLDPKMIWIARKRLARFTGERLRLYVGDAEQIEAEDNSYDAVFDFAIVHHIPVWQNSVREINRVLKPSGKFYFEEVTRQALDCWFYRTFLKHPAENRFTGEEFIKQLGKNGITVGENKRYWFFNDFVVGVGTKIQELNSKQGETI
ncbi:MAG: class I SAM-dependent methyltransferase [Acidobacteriota bacterium]|nr:class I SAM-dependent methyltransferase [Acidobacteriota bacterium]